MGNNTSLRPEAAPLWMHQLVSRATDGSLHRSLPERSMSGADMQRQAAVLILLAGAETTASLPNDAEVLLTHRTPRMRSHSGQVAFPGGRLDPTDTNPVDCALREAWEETGLDRQMVTPLAQLDQVHIRRTGYPVHPVLAHWHTPSPVRVASPDETDDVFTAPLLSLIDPQNRLMVGWNDWQGPAFKFNDYLIWGFTGGLLAAVIASAGWEQEFDPTVHDLQAELSKSRNQENQLLR
ncbi:NUDIX hydrolase [Corynebacterium epidermidicanis]|uniref:NTP pyrophosphohydrolase n=1 Tax=Corynebacterium epidermidicanis TaxID=1050174 RepID=A0A0G3GNP7_9CORY|nr:CoA pyrophosphatase [Corynebacterium epidermidicanis]AKK02165.1 NTP pyrophosphohydrolase [Corynebacterium epidermidicanis]